MTEFTVETIYSALETILKSFKKCFAIKLIMQRTNVEIEDLFKLRSVMVAKLCEFQYE